MDQTVLRLSSPRQPARPGKVAVPSGAMRPRGQRSGPSRRHHPAPERRKMELSFARGREMQRAGADVADVHRERARPVRVRRSAPGRASEVRIHGCRRAPLAIPASPPVIAHGRHLGRLLPGCQGRWKQRLVGRPGGRGPSDRSATSLCAWIVFCRRRNRRFGTDDRRAGAGAGNRARRHRNRPAGKPCRRILWRNGRASRWPRSSRIASIGWL